MEERTWESCGPELQGTQIFTGSTNKAFVWWSWAWTSSDISQTPPEGAQQMELYPTPRASQVRIRFTQHPAVLLPPAPAPAALTKVTDALGDTELSSLGHIVLQ
jgi:hypothetical protein